MKKCLLFIFLSVTCIDLVFAQTAQKNQSTENQQLRARERQLIAQRRSLERAIQTLQEETERLRRENQRMQAMIQQAKQKKFR